MKIVEENFKNMLIHSFHTYSNVNMVLLGHNIQFLRWCNEAMGLDLSLNDQNDASFNKQIVGKGKAHGKIILMGEHSVVYDYPAIALPFTSAPVNVTIQPSTNKEHILNCMYYTGPLKGVPFHLHNIQHVVQLTLNMIEQTTRPLLIDIDSQVPGERGMGSSAAVSVAVVRALCDFYQYPLANDQLHYLTNQAELIAHEATSGIDTLLASNDQAIIYRKSQAPEFFNYHLDAYLIVADSGITGQTKQAVSFVAHQLKQTPEKVTHYMSTIGDFVTQAYNAIKENDADQLGRLFTYNHYYLAHLNVSSPALDQLVNAAWTAGALGAKMTGGGLGGCVIALSKTKKEALKVSQAFKDQGAQQTWLLNMKKI